MAEAAVHIHGEEKHFQLSPSIEERMAHLTEVTKMVRERIILNAVQDAIARGETNPGEHAISHYLIGLGC